MVAARVARADATRQRIESSGFDHLDRVRTHPTRAVVMAHLNEVFAGYQIGGNAGVSVDATVIVFRDQRRLTVGAEKLHDHVSRTAGIDDVTTVPIRCEPE